MVICSFLLMQNVRFYPFVSTAVPFVRTAVPFVRTRRLSGKGESGMNSNYTPMSIPSREKENCAYIFRRQNLLCSLSDGFLYQPQFVGHYIARSTFSIERDRYRSVLALFTISGVGELHSDGAPIPLTPGTVMLLNCTEPHAYRAAADGWEFKYLHFIGASSLEFVTYMQQKVTAVHQMTPDAFRGSLRIIDSIAEETEHRHANTTTRLSSLIYELMMTLTSDAAVGTEPIKESGIEAAKDAARYIDEHFAEPIETADLAARAYMTRPYFSVLFKRVCGMTPHEYVNARRMETAKKLLSNGNQTISEIADAVGFSDASAFTRAFTRANSMTPSQFRKWFS